MFDAEKLLGGLLADGLGGGRRRKRNRGLKLQLGLGAVGLAMAAWEHFQQQQDGTNLREQQAGPPPPPQPPQSQAPQLQSQPPQSQLAQSQPPQPSAAAETSAPPSPLPGGATPTPLAAIAALTPAPASADSLEDDACLLIRAMICAANADGHIDADEQTRIIDRLVAAGLGREERAFLVRELAAPPDPQALFTAVRAARPGEASLAEQIYTVSRVTLAPSEASEHAYLARLASWLGLSSARTAELDLQALARDA